MGSRGCHGSAIAFRRYVQVLKVIVHDDPLWIGPKRMGTCRFLLRLPQLLLPPSRRHQLLKMMATRRHLMAVDAALSLRIAFNIIIEDNDKLARSNFYFNYI